jgi:[ribosomal protein S5]-alanine N-acetyltransferase
MESKQLETKRLLLKRITPLELNKNFETQDKEFIFNEMGFTNDVQYERELIRFQNGYTINKRPFLHFNIIDKNTNTILGTCGFHNWVQEHFRSEIFYGLYRDENKRKGFMAEALEAMLEYGFTAMQLNRIEACIHHENMASLALAAKFNFVLEGNLRGHYFYENEFTDSMCFSLLKNEFENKYLD